MFDNKRIMASFRAINVRTLLARQRALGRSNIEQPAIETVAQRDDEQQPRLIRFDRAEERKRLVDSEFFVNLLSQRATTPSPTLGEAACVVAGGYGACCTTTFDKLSQLADRLGAALGGTRPAVDGGFLPHDRMIGRSGCSIKPTIYLAFGISGDRLHTVGIDPSATIVAINRDADAPLCRMADWVVIGDCEEVAVWLLNRLKGGSDA